MQNLIDWIVANPYRFGFYLAAIAGFIAGPLEPFLPRGAAFLRALGMHVPGALKAIQEAKNKDDDDKPGAPPPSIVTLALGALVAVLLVSCMGCASPLATAGTVADATAATLTRAQPLLHEVCTVPMQGIAALPDPTERKARALALHDSCGKPMATYDALRRTHVMLLASIAAAAGGGVTVGELLTLTQRAVDDAAAFAEAAGGLR